ncbi:cytosolic protein [Candidatus Pacearchaeota archaeon RBG_13_36_9]|nr:MAG: cytosolic protein [Candidatus Pacearchaeota archaeon RBG_13_36_9]
MTDCKKQTNLKKCNCTYKGCERKGFCCECLSYHLKNKELPACCFPSDAEKTYDRSFEKFAELVKERKV